MTKGDIVIVEFPFTDFISSKLKPSIILLENRFDYVICFITSNISFIEILDIYLFPTPSNGLKKELIINTNKIMTVYNDNVKGIIGKLSGSKINLLNKNLVDVLS